jgi:hypothetical protein
VMWNRASPRILRLALGRSARARLRMRDSVAEPLVQ